MALLNRARLALLPRAAVAGLVGASLLSLVPPAARAVDAPASLADAVKSAYLYKFAPYVEWPPAALPAADSALTICVAGNEKIAAPLAQSIVGQHDGTHPLAFKSVTAPEASCNILYVSGTDAQMAAMLAGTQGMPILTVTETSLAGGPHGIISFVIENNHVRFDIDEAEAASSNLTISSKLLSLARHVQRAPQ